MSQAVICEEESTKGLDEKETQSKSFDDCVSQKIRRIKDEDKSMDQDQVVANAFSHCRKKFGISKARILYILEKSYTDTEETLPDAKQAIEKGMCSKDWIEFSSLLKASGYTHKKIQERVNKSESWIKKYVNPVLKTVTLPNHLVSLPVTQDAHFNGLPIHTVLEFTITELKKEQRQFAGWGSVEIKDSQDDVVSIKGLEKIMPTYIKRGAPIMFGHSNRHVGRVLKYQIKDKSVKGKLVPGLWLEGEIFNHYEIDHEAWEALQFAHKANLPVLSLGATPIGHPVVECNDKECFKKYNELQLYEFTITEQQKGSVGANPEATVEMAMAKSQAQNQTLLSEEDLEFADLMLASCQPYQDEYNDLLKQGLTENKAKETLLTELVKSMSQENDETKSDPINPDQTPPAETSKDGPDLAAALAEMGSMMKQILMAVTKNDDPRVDEERDQDEAPPVPPTEEEEKADPVQEESAPKVPALTLAKQVNQLSDEEFAKIASDRGFKSVSMPASPPSLTVARDITKGTPRKKPKRPTIEQMREAYHDNDIGVTGIEQQVNSGD